MSQPVLRIDDLALATRNRNDEEVLLVDGVSLDVAPGEALGIIGESGSGKSLLVRSVTGLLPKGVFVRGGSITFDGTSISDASDDQLRRLRGSQVGMVFQDSIGSLDPLFKVGSQLVEAIRAHRQLSKRAARREALELLEDVGITEPEHRLNAYPHELSGGIAQRVAIAIAISNSPKLLIADEATTALDVTIQAQVISLIKRIQQERGCAVLFVSHDLATVSSLVDRVAVMYAGRLVEVGPTRDVLTMPRHPYTKALLRSKPKLGTESAPGFRLAGGVPLPGEWPSGCRFHPRCPVSSGRSACRDSEPVLDRAQTHPSACHFADELNGSQDA